MLKINLKEIVKAPDDWSEIFDYREDLDKLKDALKGIEAEKVILIGNGGSITSYDAIYDAVEPEIPSATVWTMEPDYLAKVKKEFPKDGTVVIAVSKSGKTLGLIEALLFFIDYEIICVTESKPSPLYDMAEKMDWKIIPHPVVGGRYSAGTSCCMVPSHLAKIEIKDIQDGIIAGYELKDEAYSLAKYYFDLEEKGYDEVYLAIYSNRLRGFQNLIVQLMHESVCKDGKGQTFYAFFGPEAQHHTNQRFLGGKKNVIGTFITVTKPENDLKIEVSDELKNIEYKGSKLDLLDGLPYQKALEAEYIGTKEDADAKGVPNLTIELDSISTKSVAELISFWHLTAFYSSNLRGVNPFDQPAVEDSKNITLEVIKKLKL